MRLEDLTCHKWTEKSSGFKSKGLKVIQVNHVCVKERVECPDSMIQSEIGLNCPSH